MSSDRHRPAIKVAPKSNAFKQALKTGRCDHYALDIGHTTTLSAVNTYGWTGGCQSKKQAKRTNHMFEGVIDGLHLQPPGPRCIVGDINGDMCNFRALQDLLDYEGWTELGQKANIWRGTPNQHTCIAPGTSAPTRRDYVLVNTEALQLVTGFEVLHQQHFLVHSFLQVTFTPPKHDRKTVKEVKPNTMTQCLEDYCKNMGQMVKMKRRRESTRKAS